MFVIFIFFGAAAAASVDHNITNIIYTSTLIALDILSRSRSSFMVKLSPLSARPFPGALRMARFCMLVLPQYLWGRQRSALVLPSRTPVRCALVLHICSPAESPTNLREHVESVTHALSVRNLRQISEFRPPPPRRRHAIGHWRTCLAFFFFSFRISQQFLAVPPSYLFRDTGRGTYTRRNWGREPTWACEWLQ